ncbi:hypothetical protein [Algiphilus aromaticivorans]|uniref:hypothetical protein n=1 Tax=Algiphilus aromaticivorans TaxID=382454 RepID=UPI0005C227C6|nr:hypothetical protein [Algiphilus aromaticivorans]
MTAAFSRRWRRLGQALGIAGLLAIMASLFGTEAVPGDHRQPRCEARKTSEPGRLNIDSGAEGFAVQTPCEAELSFYIAANSELRALEGEARLLDAAGEVVRKAAFAAKLQDNGTGMWARDIALPEIAGHSCRSLRLELDSLRCRDADGRAIQCPSIRLKASMVMEDLTVAGEGLDVCFDD